jgi:hypothetical protein
VTSSFLLAGGAGSVWVVRGFDSGGAQPLPRDLPGSRNASDLRGEHAAQGPMGRHAILLLCLILGSYDNDVWPGRAPRTMLTGSPGNASALFLGNAG